MSGKVRPQCPCRVGSISSLCPFSYSNQWHARRDAMLLQIDLPTVQAKMATLNPQEVEAVRANVVEYLLDDSGDA